MTQSSMTQNSMTGTFITFEGGEGSGKSTQIELLYDRLCKSGYSVVKTREPGGTDIGEKIRDLLVKGKISKLTSHAELLLNFAARAEHIEHVIRPGLAQGKVILCDRFADSTIAYQGYAHGLGAEYIQAIQNLIIGNFLPDLTIIFDIDPEYGLKRTRQRKSKETRYEQMNMQFHKTVRKGFLQIAKTAPERCKIIDSSGSVEKIHNQVIKTLAERLAINVT